MRKRQPTDFESAKASRVPDLARRYSVGANVLFDAIKSGKLKASKLGDAPRSPVVVKHDDFDAYLEACAIAPRCAPEKAAA